MIALPDEKTVNSIVRNLVGYALIALVLSVCTLFGLFLNLNTYIRDDLSKNNTELRLVVTKNNEALLSLKTLVSKNQEDIKQQNSVNWKQKGELAAQEFLSSLQDEITSKTK